MTTSERHLARPSTPTLAEFNDADPTWQPSCCGPALTFLNG